MIQKAYKFRLSPTKEQNQMLTKFFGCARFVYNWGLNEKSKRYALDKTNINCFGLINQIKLLKEQKEYEWLNEIHSQVIQMALRNLDNAFTAFFNNKAKYPTFKKKNRHQSFQYPQGVKIDGNLIYLPKIGWVKFYKSRDFYGRIKTVTVSKTPSGKIFVSILCETDNIIPKKKPIELETSVGIDLGVKSFAVTSDCEVFENQKYLHKQLKRLRIELRKLERCKKDSNRREKQRIVVANLHEKIANQRNDYLHKFTTALVKRYDTIVMEDLNVSGMQSNRGLALSISELGINIFNKMLEYKCDWYGKNYIKIGRFEPSSKRCHQCGHINRNLTLKDRTWICPNCGSVLDRDFNAALNIRDYGLGAQPSDDKTAR